MHKRKILTLKHLSILCLIRIIYSNVKMKCQTEIFNHSIKSVRSSAFTQAVHLCNLIRGLCKRRNINMS